MGDEQRLPYEELISRSRESYEDGRDFTLAVEEEFAIVDPETLELVNRFEELQAAARGTPLEEHLVGELIASEVEVRTGRCESWAEASSRMAERRAQLVELADSLGVVLAATGTHPWSDWKDQRIIDTPHYRRNDELLRYVVWRNNTFGLHVHVGIKGADRAVRVFSKLRNLLPELLALSVSSPFVEGVNSGLHSARTEIFTRMFPRCGIPDPFGSWQEWEDYVRFLYETGSITEHTQVWWSVRPHLAFPTVEIRICDGQPTLEEAQALAAFLYAVDVPGRPRARRGGAAPRPPAPAARGELLAGDPLRPLRRADRPRRGRGAAGPGAPRAARGLGRARRRRARRAARRPGADGGGASAREARGRRYAPRDLRRAGDRACPSLSPSPRPRRSSTRSSG